MKKGANNSYFGNIIEGFSSLWHGFGLTFSHFLHARKRRSNIGVEDNNYFVQDKGTVTLQYPYESIPVPDNGRYRLHNEIEDCIVCDLCAKICPVNCIDIETIKSTEEIGKTSDGTTKRLYAGKFDIDMAKCCYCGLCTTVCPTECLTMTKVYDYSEFDIRNMVYHFTDLNPEQAALKKNEYEEKQKEKAAKAAADKASITSANPAVKDLPEVKKVGFKPIIKAPIKTEEQTKVESTEQEPPKVKPVIRPVMKPIISPVVTKKDEPVSEEGAKQINDESKTEQTEKKPLPRPVIRPIIPKKDKEQE